MSLMELDLQLLYLFFLHGAYASGIIKILTISLKP